MSRDHEGCIRGFCHTTEAWYGKTVPLVDQAVDEVMIGMYDPDGGTSGEFAVRWHELGGKLTPRLEVYSDAWSALMQFGDLLESMESASDTDIGPDDFCALLTVLGIRDRTERTRKDGEHQPESVQDKLVAALKLAQEAHEAGWVYVKDTGETTKKFEDADRAISEALKLAGVA